VTLKRRVFILLGVLLICIAAGVVSLGLRGVIINNLGLQTGVEENSVSLIKAAYIEGMGNKLWTPLLLINISDKIPTKAEMPIWQLANPKFVNSIVFGCNWTKGWGGSYWRLNIFINAQLYKTSFPGQNINDRLNRGVVRCLMKVGNSPEFDNIFDNFINKHPGEFGLKFK